MNGPTALLANLSPGRTANEAGLAISSLQSSPRRRGGLHDNQYDVTSIKSMIYGRRIGQVSAFDIDCAPRPCWPPASPGHHAVRSVCDQRDERRSDPVDTARGLCDL